MDLFSYAVGRSSGRRAAEFEHSRDLNDAHATIRALDKKVQALRADLSVVEPNRDHLHRVAWELHYQLEQANKDIDRLFQMLDERGQHAAELQRTIEVAEKSSTEFISHYARQKEFYFSLLRLSMFLHEQADAGKASRPEYAELKTLLEDLQWSDKYDHGDVQHHPNYGQRITALLTALRR